MNEYKDLKLTVASSPHVNSPVNTRQLMLDVLIALVPPWSWASTSSAPGPWCSP